MASERESREDQNEDQEFHPVPGLGSAANVRLYRLVFTSHESTALMMSSLYASKQVSEHPATIEYISVASGLVTA
jgi:hypothetical protein